LTVDALGLIGLGLLGTAIAARLRSAGRDVLGYDLSNERRDALVAAGGRSADAAVEVARQCDTIVLSLPDSRVAASVLAEIEPALRPAMLIIDTTTGDPQDAQRAGAALDLCGVCYLDATVAGSSAQVAQGQALMMVGGTADAFASARDVLAAIGPDVVHVGPWGSGARMKLVVNLVLGLNRAVLAEGLVLAESLGLDGQRTLDILRTSAAYSKVMDTKGPKMLADDFSPQARLSQHLKDVRLILAAAERTGAELPLSVLHRELLERAEAAGCGELDNSAIIRAFRGGRNPRSKSARDES
jgi:3-hydroxyisobutyrate dehydrogenase-like beta-hydroxyacid dehydrogenase